MNEQIRKMLGEMFVEESVRGARCAVAAAKAGQQGETGLAALFRAVQTASEVQARRILFQLRGGLPELAAFVREMEADRREGFRDFLPRVKEAAERTGDHREAELADRFRRVAANHASLLKKVAEDRNRDDALFVCTVCGFIAEGSIPEKCPVCGAVPGRFAATV